MNNPRGRIVTVTLDERSPHALVEVDADVQCARCKEGKGCGAGLLGGGGGSRRVEARIGADVTVHEGDEVRIEIAPANLLKAALVVYGLPLSAALSGAAFAFVAGLGEFYAVVTAVGGILTGIVVARWRLRRARCLRDFTPIIVERLQVGN
jgi:sigma-E factor negative regulatory protein RseC